MKFPNGSQRNQSSEFSALPPSLWLVLTQKTSRGNYPQAVNAVMIRTGGNIGYLLCVYSFQAVLFCLLF